MPDAIYVPVLKGRQGEFAALKSIQPTTRESLLPLVEIVPGPADEAAAVKAVVERSAMKLRPWAGSRILLDAGLLPIDIELHDGFGAVGLAVTEVEARGVSTTPVVRLNDESQAERDVARVHAEYGRGAAVRLYAEDLEEDAEDINDAVAQLLGRLELMPHDVDVILDAGIVIGDLAVRAGSRLVADVLRDLDNIEKFRQVIVSAGAFPPDLSAFGPWTLGEQPRYDAALFDHLQQRKRIPRIPLFGDYAVANPLHAAGRAFPPAPQLRYTVADRWLILKGRRNDPRGHDQFYEVCETLAMHPEFVGVALGNADARIAAAREHGPGNASTWREIGTTHHLDYVVRRLTTLGEP